MKRLQPYIPAIAIFCLALLVRLVYNLTVARGYVPAFDARYYDTIAKNLLTEHCFCLVSHVPTTDRAPLWPFIIAGIYSITGPKNFYARLFFSLISSGACVLIYLYAKDVFNRRIGIITGTLAAIYTGLFIYDGWLYSESLYTALMLAFAYSLYQLQRNHQARWAVISGITLGLASLTRPNGFFALGMLFLWTIIVIRAKIVPWRIALRTTLLITLLTVALIAPWTIRNYSVAHIFIPVATGSGVVLAGVYNDTALNDKKLAGMWVTGRHIQPPIPRHPNPSYMGEEENRAYALNWIRTHLSSMPYLLSLHFINMWKPYTSEDGLPVIQFPQRTSSKITWWLMQYMPIPVIFLAAVGVLVTWRRWSQLLISHLLILLTIAQAIIFYGSMRFRSPIEPLLILLVGGTLWWFTQNDADTLRALLSKRRNAPETTTVSLPGTVTEPIGK
jgi:4-amino-4-deoxy-L-arabinose transferase-like glycosyltransferase